MTPSGTYLTSTGEIKLITDATSGGEVKVRGVNDCVGSGDYSEYSWPLTFTRATGIEFLEYPQTVPMGVVNTYTFSVLLITGVSYEWRAPSGWSINGGGNTYTGENAVQVTTGECPTEEKVLVRMLLEDDYSPWVEFSTTVSFPAINTPGERVMQYQPATFSLDMSDEDIESVEWLVDGNSVGMVTNTSSLSFSINEPGIVNISARLKLTGCSAVTLPEVEVDVAKAPVPVISGPYTILGSATYSINGFDGLPEGASVAWGTSNGNLALVSSEGGTAVFRGDYYGECSITATVSFNDVNIELPPRSVQVDIDLSPLSNAMITGPDFVCGPFASFTFENLPDSSWVNWDRGAYPTDSNSPYTVNISSYSGAPGIAKVTAEITYKGKPQGLTHEYGFSFNSPGTRYVEDSVIMIHSTYYDSYRGIASVSLSYLYPAFGITYEWTSPDQGWTLVHGGTDYAEFEGPLEVSPVTIRMCFTNPCGGRTCLVREVYLPDFSSGGGEPFSMVLSAGGDMLNVELDESLIGRASVPGSYEVQIWSAGSLLRRVTADRRTCQVSLGGLPAGIYFVRVVKDGKPHVRKLIKK